MINCIITSSLKTTRYSRLQGITLPTFNGRVQLLPGHAEAFILLREGDVVLRLADGQRRIVRINGGECHVKKDAAVIIL